MVKILYIVYHTTLFGLLELPHIGNRTFAHILSHDLIVTYFECFVCDFIDSSIQILSNFSVFHMNLFLDFFSLANLTFFSLGGDKITSISSSLLSNDKSVKTATKSSLKILFPSFVVWLVLLSLCALFAFVRFNRRTGLSSDSIVEFNSSEH